MRTTPDLVPAGKIALTESGAPVELLVFFDSGEFGGSGFGGDDEGFEVPLAVRFDELGVIGCSSDFLIGGVEEIELDPDAEALFGGRICDGADRMD